MRFDEALFELAFSKTAVYSVAGATAALALAGGIYMWQGDDEIPADAVTVSGPIFKPIAMTVPAPVPAVNPNSARPSDSFATLPPDESVLVRNIQRRLQAAHCYGGAANGAWSAGTRRGMAEFTHRANARLPVDRPAPELLSLIEQNADIVCGADCADGSCAPHELPRPRNEEIATVDPAPALAAPRPREMELSSPPSAEPVAPETASIDGPDAAGVVPVVPGMQRDATAEPRRPYRKYKRKPSFAREVNKSFKSIQRAFGKLF